MSAHHLLCSRENSRQARNIITKNVYPYLAKDPELAIPPECPLHPSLDIYKHQEANKLAFPGKADTFQCGYCQKRFKTEFYMDRHMDNKHADRLNLDERLYAGAEPDSGRCLADLCPALGCGEHAADECSVEIHGGGGAGAAGAADGGGKMRRGCGMCDPADMEWRTRRCILLFDGCFNASGGSDAAQGGTVGSGSADFGDLRDHLVRQFCDHLACDAHSRPLAPPLEGEGVNRRRPFPRGGRGVGGDGMGMPKAFLIMVVIIGLIIFYVSMALGRRSRSTRSDLRPIKKQRVGGGGRGEREVGVVRGIRGSAEQLRLRRRVNRYSD
ncbi:unnamed protein product [Pylaiella littoralis]